MAWEAVGLAVDLAVEGGGLLALHDTPGDPGQAREGEAGGDGGHVEDRRIPGLHDPRVEGGVDEVRLAPVELVVEGAVGLDPRQAIGRDRVDGQLGVEVAGLEPRAGRDRDRGEGPEAEQPGGRPRESEPAAEGGQRSLVISHRPPPGARAGSRRPARSRIGEGRPSFRRRAAITTSSTLERGSWCSSQHPETISPRDTTLPALPARRRRTANSLGRSGRTTPSRRTSWRPESISRSPIRRTVGSSPGPPARQGPDAGHELLHREGLDQVVVAARVEAGDPVADLVPGGQEEHRNPHAPGRARPGGARGSPRRAASGRGSPRRSAPHPGAPRRPGRRTRRRPRSPGSGASARSRGGARAGPRRRAPAWCPSLACKSHSDSAADAQGTRSTGVPSSRKVRLGRQVIEEALSVLDVRSSTPASLDAAWLRPVGARRLSLRSSSPRALILTHPERPRDESW